MAGTTRGHDAFKTDTYSSGRTAHASARTRKDAENGTYLLRNDVLARERLGGGGRGRHGWWSWKGRLGAQTMTLARFWSRPQGPTRLASVFHSSH